MKEPVTALRKFLLENQLETLFGFIDSLGVNVSLSTEGLTKAKKENRKRKYLCRIYIQEGESIKGRDVQTVREYCGSNHGKGIKPAVCDALAKFFIAEAIDFHSYKEGKINES